MSGLKKTDSGFEDTVLPRQGVADFIEAMTPYKGLWVHFRSDESFELAQTYSNEITPQAIYGLDVTRMVAMAEAQLSARSPNKTFFHHIGFNRRPVACVFDPSGTVVNGNPYKDYPTHWERMVEYVEGRYPDTAPLARQYHPRPHYTDAVGFQALLYATEAICDHVLKLEGDGPYKPHSEKPALWRQILMATGVDAIEDRFNFLTGDCDHQIAALNADKMKLIQTFDNPLSSEVKFNLTPG
jgi:hypothetical protein